MRFGARRRRGEAVGALVLREPLRAEAGAGPSIGLPAGRQAHDRDEPLLASLGSLGSD